MRNLLYVGMRCCVAAAFSLFMMPLASMAGVYNLTVDKVMIDTGSFTKEGII